MKKIKCGRYEYKGYILQNIGYYPPDKKVVWEAHDPKTGEGSFHAYSKRQLKYLIDKDVE